MSKTLNKKYIRWHLQEAAESIAKLTAEIDGDNEWEIGGFSADMRHIYHHVNSAWNSRYASEKETAECTEENYMRWEQYPPDLEIF